MEENKEEIDNVGKKIIFLHAGWEVTGTIIEYKPKGYSITYLYRATDKNGIKYCITKNNVISVS